MLPSPSDLKTKLSTSQLTKLWNLFSSPADREALMMFLANASKVDDGAPQLRPENSMHNIDKLTVGFVENVHIFQSLFCSATIDWEKLGQAAYISFQNFDAREARDSEQTTDALWRICLSAGNDIVASRAMSDLLAVYNGRNSTGDVANSTGAVAGPSFSAVASGAPADTQADENPEHQQHQDNDAERSKRNHQFSQRIFNYLVQVKDGLQRGDPTSERSAERCIRILSTAMEQCHSLGGTAGAVAERLGNLLAKQGEGTSPLVEEYLNLVPHGMRGVYSCGNVSVTARVVTSRSGDRNNSGSPSNPPSGEKSTAQQPDRFALQIHPLQTLSSIKYAIAVHCNHNENMIKLTNLSGRSGNRGDSQIMGPRSSLNNLPENTLASDLGIVDGTEIIALLSDKVVQQQAQQMQQLQNSNAGVVQGPVVGPEQQSTTFSRYGPAGSSLDLSGLLSRNGPDGSSDLFFDTLISVLESLPVASSLPATIGSVSILDKSKKSGDTHSLVWDLLLAMPTNAGIIANVHVTSFSSRGGGNDDTMAVEPISGGGVISDWSSLLDFAHFERSVYVMQILDSLLRPATSMFSSLPNEIAATSLSKKMEELSTSFRTRFISSGGFEAVLRLFIQSGKGKKDSWRRNRMGNECALRIIKECFFAKNGDLSKEGREMIEYFAGTASCGDFLISLVSFAIHQDCGVSDNASLRILMLVRMMLESTSGAITNSFTNLPDNAAETFLTSLLLWKGSGTTFTSIKARSAANIRKSTEEMILAIPLLSSSALPWLVKSLKSIDPSTEGSEEFFSVLLKLVSSVNRTDENAAQLRELGNAVCIKLASHPRPNGETVHIDHTTGVLCGCLKLLIALIELRGDFLVEGSTHIMQSLNISPWSGEEFGPNGQLPSLKANDKAMVDLMGSIFDGFISSANSSGLPPICCDVESRRLAFHVISAAAQVCSEGAGYSVLADKINGIIGTVAPALRHRWGQNASADDGHSMSSRNSANTSVKYSGLKNQGCTCYMNSVLQQLFMMPALRKNLCSAELPTSVRSSGGGAMTKGDALVGKKISVHWENGNKYDAMVDKYEERTGMHTISYCPIQLATPGHQQQQQAQPPDISSLPRDLPEEFVLSEGRPGKETGAFEIISNATVAVQEPAHQQDGSELKAPEDPLRKSLEEGKEVKESPDEASSRKLLEEVQRTLVNLDEARGRCFDPRSLVEASHCLKLEFDVWQQNDASEFCLKLLDRLEISMKKWSPSHFKYLEHTFGMKQTKQKICKECGLKVRISLAPEIV